MISTVTFFIVAYLLCGCSSVQPVHYIDQDVPDSIPKVFAKGTISPEDRLEQIMPFLQS